MNYLCESVTMIKLESARAFRFTRVETVDDAVDHRGSSGVLLTRYRVLHFEEERMTCRSRNEIRISLRYQSIFATARRVIDRVDRPKS